MRYLKKMALYCIAISILSTSCSKDAATGATIAAQVSGKFMSTNAKVIVDQETLLDASEGYEMRIVEVDANTVSVITDHTPAFEVDLSK